MKRRWETKWDGLDLMTKKIRKGRRRSPEMGVEVGFEGAEVELELELDTELESSEIEGWFSS